VQVVSIERVDEIATNINWTLYYASPACGSFSAITVQWFCFDLELKGCTNLS